jgi:hypothetical protein
MASEEGAISSTEIKALKLGVIELAKKPRLNFYKLAVSIEKLHIKDLSAFGQIPMQTGMSRRRAYYLLDVGRLIRSWELSPATAEAIGLMKLQIITRHALENDGASDVKLETYLSLALSTKVRDLRNMLDGEVTSKIRAEVFHLTLEEQFELRKALVAYGAQKVPAGLSSKEIALMRLAKAAMKAKD